MKYVLLAAALLLAPSMAEAVLKPMDFAYGMPLSLEENGAVYRLDLPREVYETVTRDDLADIRVFNSVDAVVPHVLRRPDEQNEILEESQELPFFPLYGGEYLPEKEGLSMRVEKSGRQTMIHVLSGEAGDREGLKLSGYIIDAREHKTPIQEFEVAWQANDASFVMSVSLDSSGDMSRWASLVPQATLARMRYQDHEILRNRIQVPPRPAAYYRLTWPADRDGLAITRIKAIRNSGILPAERQWTALAGEPGRENGDQGLAVYEYESPARLPLDRIRLRFAENNTLLQATFFSRSDREAKWQYRQSGVFYHLNFGPTPLVQDTAVVGPTSDRYWRVVVEEGAFSDPGTIPVVEGGWLPFEMLFVARGQGPFMLAYGSTRLAQEMQESEARGTLSRMVGGDKAGLLKEAAVSQRRVLGGPDRLVPLPPPMPWKTWLLWGVLVAGVGVIARMAVRLAKAIPQEERH